LSAAAQTSKETRRVLIVNDLGIISSPGFAEIDQALVAGLQTSPYHIELYQENLEVTLFPDRDFQRRFREEFIRRYSERKPDVIIAAGSDSLKFLADVHENFLRDTPVVFCAILGEIPDRLRSEMQVTGVLGSVQPEETLDVALRLLPRTKHVVVTGGTGEFDYRWEAIAKESFHKYESRLEFTYLTDLGMPTLLERLRKLPSDTIVYHTAISQDSAGERFIDSAQAVPLVVSAANAPVFVIDDVDLRDGTVGGYLVNWADDASAAAGMAVRILKGEKPQDIPVIKSKNQYMFDSSALKRWGMKESSVPPGSILLNRQPGLWEAYKWYLIAGLFLLIAQTALIAGLLWQRATRRKAEAELALTYDRLRLAVEAGKSVGWDWDLKTGQDRWFGDLQNMFGIPSDTQCGHVEDFRRRVHPGDKELVWKAVADAKQSHEPYTADFRVIRDDGTLRWITARGKFYYRNNGEPERMVGMAVDITDRKLAEQRVHESEERFRLVANTAPVMIWTTGTDKLCNYVNKPWLDFTGRAFEQELGSGWAEGIHSEDVVNCLKTYTEAFDKREQFEMQYRLRRHDGELRWVLDIGVPRFNQDGSFVGYIGSCIDVTERKRAEEALSTIGRRLIEAHEEERTWIGRELHDDINQRLALLAVELDLWSKGGSRSKFSEHLSHAQNRITEISKDVQALSHRLHSSKLDYLGLTAAARSFCKELSDKAGVEVQFSPSAVPSTLPKEVSLCLFRILQEALQNAVKYSGVKVFRVNLCGTPDGMELTVSDDGIGFDEHDWSSRQGLGLISMRERLQMVDGAFDIRTHPGGGTTISARVPLREAEMQAKAG
jgi:PAS domain S-box-containing protein